MDLDETLQRGIAAARAGQKETARTLLLQVVEADETQIQGWLWLSEVVDGPEDKEVCLENILALDPHNVFAQDGLARLRAEKAGAARATPQDDEFDNEWLCPYCAALTGEADEICPNCRQALYTKERFSPKRSVWIWRGFFLQAYLIFFLIAFQAAAITILVKQEGLRDPIPFLPAYFGLAVDQPAEAVAAVFRVYPPALFWAIIGGVLYSLLVMGILMLRVRGGQYLYLFNAGVVFVLSIYALVTVGPRSLKFVAGLGVLVGLLQLIITVNLRRDFMFKGTRLWLRADRTATNHTALYQTARDYARRGMWAAAVIHLRRAVAKKSNELRYQLALTTAYMNIHRYDLAEQTLQAAAQLDPGSGEVQTLKRRLAAVQKR